MFDALPTAGTSRRPMLVTRIGGVPEATVRRQVTIPLRLADGYATEADVFSFDGLVDEREHVALGLGDWRAALTASAAGGPAPLVRPHSECLTGDVFGSQRCDCGPQFHEAVRRITTAGGLLLYLRQEGRGIGLYQKLDAYALQDRGLDTYQANLALDRGEDERDYTVAAQMLHALGVTRIELLSNNPDKAEQLGRLGIQVSERIPTGLHLSAANAKYLAAKASHRAHTLQVPPDPRWGSGSDHDACTNMHGECRVPVRRPARGPLEHSLTSTWPITDGNDRNSCERRDVRLIDLRGPTCADARADRRAGVTTWGTAPAGASHRGRASSYRAPAG